MAVRNSNIVDFMKQDYLTRGGWAGGIMVPPPLPTGHVQQMPAGLAPSAVPRPQNLPKPAAGHLLPSIPGRGHQRPPPQPIVRERRRPWLGEEVRSVLQPRAGRYLVNKCPPVNRGTPAQDRREGLSLQVARRQRQRSGPARTLRGASSSSRPQKRRRTRNNVRRRAKIPGSRAAP